MENHRKYPPLERPRLMESGSSVGSGGSNGSSIPSSASEYAARVSTPTTMTTLPQYHNRYTLPPAMSGPNLAIMSSLLGGGQSLKPKSNLLPDIQHYWNASPEPFPRYLMASSLYPTYPSLLAGSEPLSLLGTGVACVSSGAATGMGPSQPHHVAHYQQLLELQKEAYLASMSTAHHTAIYGITSTGLSPFLDQNVVSTHSPTPLSLVKQEPKEQSCSDKTAAKQGERRSSAGFKVDNDLNKNSRDTASASLTTSAAGTLNTPLKEPKLSPTYTETPVKLDKKGGGSRATSNNSQNGRRVSTPVCDSSSTTRAHSGSKQNKTAQSASPSPSPRIIHSPHVQSSSAKRSVPQPSISLLSNRSQTQTPTSASHNTSIPSSPAFILEPPIVSVPTKAPVPIALATVQHDGVVLSALASPSSAAASSISAKTVLLKQQADKPDHFLGNAGKSTTDTTISFNGYGDRLVGATNNCDHAKSNGRSDRNNHRRTDKRDQSDDSKQLSDDNSDIIVDSTESDDNLQTKPPTKSDHERAIEDTIERVASAVHSDASDQDDASPQSSTTPRHSSNSSLRCATRVDPASSVTISGSSSTTRTVYAKAQPVLSVPGNIPVGIAVAQIRPHHVQQPKDSLAQESATRDTRNVHTTISTKTISTPSVSSLTAPASSLVVTGPAVNKSPWIQQMSFPIHQPISPSGTTFDPSFPITAPSGYKFAQDSLTGHFFLIPSGDFVKPGAVWSSPSFATAPTESGNTHYQATLNPPTVNETEKKEDNTDKSSSTSISEKSIPAAETISKDKPGVTIDNEKHIKSQSITGINKGNPSQGGLISSTTAATVLINPVTNANSTAPSVLVKLEQPSVKSRGCSPIHFEDTSTPLSLLSTLSCLSYEKPKTCTVAVQTCESLMRSSCKRKLLLNSRAVQTSSHDFSTFNPLSVQCPDLDSVDPLTHSLEDKTNSDRVSYNPFTDPQILQAADGLELLSTLAEKRPKCSSLDDPKRIYPSPSDSFKSDSASIVAFDDTLSPGEMELKSGQCTPRREILRDLSPKWSLPKKDSHTLSAFADFKTPSEIDIQDDSEVRIKLAEVQRQYKEKQKGLAKLQSKKNEESKLSKRGPGRPPKKKTPSKKSDDESSSSSSKTKEHQLPKKKKIPAEELVDRVFRKLPPVIKPSKVSRSIHYVKSKTGPFFRRKSASSSVKQNKDLFGYDESTWPSFSERKHQEKVKGTENTNGPTKNRHRSSPSQSDGSKMSQDAGNIFSNMESFGAEYDEKLHQPHDNFEKKGRPSKLLLHKHEKFHISSPSSVAIKTEHSSMSSHNESGLGLLAKFALNASAAPMTSPVTTPLLTSSSSSVTNHTPASSTTGSFNSTAFSSSNNIIYGNGVHNSSSTVYSTCINEQTPNITFGAISSFVCSATMMNFSSSTIAAASSLNISTSAAVQTTTFAPLAISTVSSHPVSPTSSGPSTCALTPAQLFPSIEVQEPINEDSSSTTTSSCIATTSSTINVVVNSPRNSISRNSSPFNNICTTEDTTDLILNKRSLEEDSDTDASDTSLNKKRKPGRPRKMNLEKSTCGTETIWAKKSPSIIQQQAPEPDPSQIKDEDNKKMDPNSMKPLFLDEEWTRRRSERIFLSESSPQPSPALSPAPRGEIVWKLSHFMPKSRKMLDVNKSIKDNNDKSKDGNDSDKQASSLNTDSSKTSELVTVTSSSGLPVKTETKESMTWTPAKTVEISTIKMEDKDTKIIMKLEEKNPQPSESTTMLKVEDPEKKSVKKKVKKNEIPPTLTLPTLEMKEKRAEENSKIKLQKAKSLHDLTQRVKKKFSKAGMKKQDDYQLKKTSKDLNKKRKISTDSSDTDNIPLVSYRANPPTPEPRSCKLQQSDLREGLKVLYLVDGLFHEGTVKALQPPDVYGVLTAGQRGNRPHILCLEEILKWAVLDVKPGSLRYLPEGTRVCAFWSQQFSCLYPGTVAKSSPISNGKKVVISVEFDDGDNGRIELDHIRLLPSDFPIVEYEPDPLETLPKRKQRAPSDASDRKKSSKTEPKTSKQSKEEEEDIDDEDNDDNRRDDEDSDSSNHTGTAVRRELWRWDGKSTKRPGLKGKAKKVFYKAITRRKETIRVGDSAIFVSKERVNCPYIGRIESLWEGWNGQKMVRVQWYYHPEETECNKKLSDPRNALFESQHEDENDVQTIAHKCEVLSYAQYKKRLNNVTKKGRALKSNLFFVAGFYDPTAKNVTFHSGVS